MRSMKRLLPQLAVAALTAFVFTANAQFNRTWVSGLGDDMAVCSRSAPCKTFAGAISKTNDGGIINVLDAGGFGAVTITKSITIDGDGAHAGVLVSGANAFNVNGAGIKVMLRNLSIEAPTVGAGRGLVGVNFVQGSELVIENCRIFGFLDGTATAIRASLANTATLVVKNTSISDSGTGIHLQNSAGLLLATIDGTSIVNVDGNGIETAGTSSIFAAVRRSTIDHMGVDGIRANTGLSTITVTDSLVSLNNGIAVSANAAGARVRISGNTIVNNAVGLNIAGGAFMESDGTNRIAGNSLSAIPNAVFTNQ